jgi:site-specific recombinase XerD
MKNRPVIGQYNEGVLKEYLAKCRRAGLAESSIDCYDRVLCNFLSYVGKDVNQLTKEDARKWLKDKYADKKKTTKAHRVTILNSFIEFCILDEYLQRTIISKRWYPRRMTRPLPKGLTNDEFATVRVAIGHSPKRDRTISDILLDAGLRIAEAVNLDIKDIDFRAGSIRVIGKGNKERIVPIAPESAMLLQDLIKTLPEGQTAVFLNRFGKRITTRGARDILYKIGEKAKISRKLSPHKCRHTRATRDVRSGCTITDIQKRLGHARLSTTAIYADLNDEVVRQTYFRCMEV